MKDYLVEIIIQAQRDLLNEPDTSAVVIMDNFKGQITPDIFQILEKNNIHSCLLPPNTTDRLQPMDISVNKSVKVFMRNKFDKWYADQIGQQLAGKDMSSVTLDPVDLSMPCLRELGASWLVEMADYISSNPDIIVNGFIRSGISTFLSGIEDDVDGADDDEDVTDNDDDDDDEPYEDIDDDGYEESLDDDTHN